VISSSKPALDDRFEKEKKEKRRAPPCRSQPLSSCPLGARKKRKKKKEKTDLKSLLPWSYRLPDEKDLSTVVKKKKRKGKTAESSNLQLNNWKGRG